MAQVSAKEQVSFTGNYQATISGPFPSGWSVQIVASLQPQKPPDSEQELTHITITGTELPTDEHATYRYHGSWQRHPKFGLQFRCEMAVEELPVTLEGMEAFLASGFVRGIGKVTAKRIVERFGEDTFRVIEEEPDKLLEIPRLSKARAKELSESYKEASAVRDIITALSPFGVRPSLAVKINEHFDDPLKVVRETPYALCGSRIGIGFRTADQIAQSNGVSPASMLRYASGIRYLLRAEEEQGHTYTDLESLIESARELLSVEDYPYPERSHVLQTLVQMQKQLMVVVENPKLEPYALDSNLETADLSKLTIMNYRSWVQESELARSIRLHQQTRPSMIRDLDQRLTSAQRGLGFEPSEQQIAAVRLAAEESVVVITGVPGSGKTTTLRLLLNTLLPKHPILTAPTGRAARRMSESSGYQAQTLHKALGFRKDEEDGELFQSGDNSLEDADLIVVDEMSMTDLSLAERLFQAIPKGARLILIGDPDQLPSVGYGNVLADLLASPSIPQVRLDVIFRQGETSQIIANARKIRHGETDLEYGRDVHLIDVNSREEAHEQVIELYKQLRETVAADELMVLSPVKGTRRGQASDPQPAGTIALNNDLQEAVNPEDLILPSLKRGQKTWRVGDRIMELRNQLRQPLDDETREEMVSNGDTGILEEIHLRTKGSTDPEKQKDYLVVSFNGERYRYSSDDLEHLDHAYAATIHKSQGSEYETVILVLLRQHGWMLQRNLIYTALTRAKHSVYLVGQKEAVVQAIQSVRNSQRRTRLTRRLAENSASRDAHVEGVSE